MELFVFSIDNLKDGDLNVESTGKEEPGVVENMRNCKKYNDKIPYLYQCFVKSNEKDSKTQNVDISVTLSDKNNIKLKKQYAGISIIKKKYSVIIQTDKPKYKPGDEVHMRIFFIKPNGKPVQLQEIGSFHIEVRNKYDEPIVSFTIEKYKRVVYTRKFTISENAFLGMHKILVWSQGPFNQNYGMSKSETNAKKDDEYEDLDNTGNAQNENDEKDVDHGDSDYKYDGSKKLEDAVIQEFEVGKFLLPEFEVFVETERNILPGNNINLKVYAKYPYGKYVKGKVTITATIDLNGNQVRKFLKESNQIDTVETIILDVKNDLKVNTVFENYDVKITVEFQEILTKKVVDKKVVVTILQKPTYLVRIEPENESFVPGKNYEFDVYLRDINGKAMEYSNEYINVRVVQNYRTKLCHVIIDNASNSETITLKGKRVENGKAHFVIQVPDNTTSMSITAKYQGSSSVFNTLRTVTVSREYLSIVAPKKS